MSAADCPVHGRDGCKPADCPDYMARFLLGACSSGDPLRRAVTIVVAEFQRRTAELSDVRAERDSLNDALRDTAERASDVEDEAYLMWCAADDAGAF